MNVNISIGEEYPVYWFYKEGGIWFRKYNKIFKIDDKKMAELEEIFKKHNEAQEYLKGLYNEKD